MKSQTRFTACLDILQRMEAESVDLIYLDPPFNSTITICCLAEKERSGTGEAFAPTEEDV